MAIAIGGRVKPRPLALRYDLSETTILIADPDHPDFIPVHMSTSVKILKAVEYSEICIKNNTNLCDLIVPYQYYYWGMTSPKQRY